MMSRIDPTLPASGDPAPERDTRLIWAGLFFALAVFSKLPGLDLLVSERYFVQGQGFVHAQDPVVQWLYVWTPWLGRGLLVGLVTVSLFGRRLGAWISRQGPGQNPETWGRWGRFMAGSGRHTAILATCAALLGPGLIIEGLFKNTVGRPRPVQVDVFGGPAVYQGPFAIGAEPGSHKSFCSSHAATGFALMGLGLGCGPVWRRRWFLIGTVAGAVVGMGRILQGGHYLSDIIFAFYVVWLSCEWVAWMDHRRTMRMVEAARRTPRP
jgi:lipid A 4'-phosphatase